MADIFGDDFDDKKRGSEDFAKLFEESESGVEKRLSPGDKIQGEILTIGKDEYFVSTGTVNDGVALKSELLDDNGEFPHQVGDTLEFYVVKVEDNNIFLSTKPTAINLAEGLEDAAHRNLPIEGRVTEQVKGGFRVALQGGQTAFCPISQMDARFVEEPENYLNKKFEFLITQFERRNIVVSRRRLLDQQQQVSQGEFLKEHKVEDVVNGIVTRIEKFGAFIEVAPGLEGLAHISELAWSRTSNPEDVVEIGQQVQAKILKIEDNGNRLNISLSLKQATPEPWETLPEEIREGRVVQGRVTRCMKFGAFVEVAPGIEGLVPLSEMSHTKHVVRSEEEVQEGQNVSVLIKEVRPDDRKLLLSIKDAGENPWDMVPHRFPVGTVVEGKVERREPFGLFISLDEGITGLLPKSKASEVPEFPFDKLKVGNVVNVQVLEIQPEQRRITLAPPQDVDSGAWRDHVSETSKSSGMGTLGDQLKGLLKKD